LVVSSFRPIAVDLYEPPKGQTLEEELPDPTSAEKNTDGARLSVWFFTLDSEPPELDRMDNTHGKREDHVHHDDKFHGGKKDYNMHHRHGREDGDEDHSKRKTKKAEKAINIGMAWIDHAIAPPPDEPFTKKDGFDIYIDGCRWLPDGTAVPAVDFKLMTMDLKKVSDDVRVCADVHSPAMCPSFHDRPYDGHIHRQEFHDGPYDPTTMLLVRIDSFDLHSAGLKVIGYAALNIFVDRDTCTKQPRDKNEQEFALNAGAFQLPVYQGPPSRKVDFTDKTLGELHPTVPCATILVRIIRAQLSDDGFSLKSANDMDIYEAEDAGLVFPAPDYEDKLYDSTRCKPSKSEKKLYSKHNESETLAPVSELVLKAEEDPEKAAELSESQEHLTDWFLSLGKPKKMIDFGYIAHYTPSIGFKFVIDRVHNMPDPGLFASIGIVKCIYSLSPPAPFYQEEKLTDEVEFTTQHDWESPQRSQKFKDGWHAYRDITMDQNLVIIIDVRSVKQKKHVSGHDDEVEVKPIGWAVLPVFTEDGYVRSDSYQVRLIKSRCTFNARRLYLISLRGVIIFCFRRMLRNVFVVCELPENLTMAQLPLFDGSPNHEIVQQMQCDGADAVIEENLDNKKGVGGGLKWGKHYSSVFVRLVDDQVRAVVSYLGRLQLMIFAFLK